MHIKLLSPLQAQTPGNKQINGNTSKFDIKLLESICI